jgi:hypothetical protein
MFGFDEVAVADFEYFAAPGERPLPVCLVAQELVSGRTHRVFQEELLSMRHPPYPIGPDVLFVAHYAPAEISCYLVLGWQVPLNIVDTFAEFANLTNGRYLPHGRGLVGALTYFGLPTMSVVEKERNRQLVMRGAPYTGEERRTILDYCQTDVDGAHRLLLALWPNINIDHALLRGRYMAAAAQIEHTGIPIDMERLGKLQKYWVGIQDRVIETVDADYGVFDGRTFKGARWEQWVNDHDIPWPRLPTGHLALDDATFRQRALAYPAIAPIRELRQMLGKMRISTLAIGADGRNRTGLWPFAARTGRNQPKSSEFIMGLSVWVRSLIRAEPRHVVANNDYSQQEFGIAAALSGDPAMIRAYQSGDPYMTFAQQAGAAPLDATKESHGAVREKFKTCALGTLYNMGAGTLAERTGLVTPYAADLLRLHHVTYPQFWDWSDRVVDYALLYNNLHTVFGWNLIVGGEPNPNSLRNFPMQANGAEMLRLACCLAVERGVTVIAPVHDSLLIEASVGDSIEAIITARRAMAEASRIVLGNLTLRTDVKVFSHPMRYIDKRGLPMWNTVWKLIRELEAGK